MLSINKVYFVQFEIRSVSRISADTNFKKTLAPRRIPNLSMGEFKVANTIIHIMRVFHQLLADPGKARGCPTKTALSLIN